MAHLIAHLIFLGRENKPDLLVQRELVPILDCFLRPAENPFPTAIFGTCGHLSDEVLKTCCQCKRDSRIPTEWSLDFGMAVGVTVADVLISVVI